MTISIWFLTIIIYYYYLDDLRWFSFNFGSHAIVLNENDDGPGAWGMSNFILPLWVRVSSLDYQFYHFFDYFITIKIDTEFQIKYLCKSTPASTSFWHNARWESVDVSCSLHKYPKYSSVFAQKHIENRHKRPKQRFHN